MNKYIKLLEYVIKTKGYCNGQRLKFSKSDMYNCPCNTMAQPGDHACSCIPDENVPTAMRIIKLLKMKEILGE